MTKLTGKVLVTSGGTQGIGEAIALLAAENGAAGVVITGRQEAKGQAVVERINARGAQGLFVAADLSSVDDCRNVIQQCDATFGRVDALVNAAADTNRGTIESTTPEFWDYQFHVNVRAPFLLSQQLAGDLEAAGGAIVNIVDVYAEKPLAGHPLYCMAKAGLAMMTKSLARELGPAVRVNGVSPGAILWPEQGQENQQAILDATALGRAGDPDDIAATVAWLALEAPYITGQILAVDGGRSLSFPGG